MQIGERGDLRREDRIGLCGDRGGEIGLAPGGRKPVDADDHLALAEAARGDRIDNLLPRDLLGVGRDGIFEVEDHRVGGNVARLLHRPGVGAGHVEHRTARPDGLHGKSCGGGSTAAYIAGARRRRIGFDVGRARKRCVHLAMTFAMRSGATPSWDCATPPFTLS